MAKQQQTITQQIVQFITEFNSNPFQDFYIMLVFRFIVYIYLFIKLSDILMGHEKPNIKTRVLRKFQIVYGGDILKQMDNQDMQQLQVTISNTILNATKELKPKSYHQKVSNDNLLVKDNGLQSERRSLKIEETSQLSGSSLSKKSSKLKFDLQKNQYFDPVNESSIKKQQKIPRFSIKSHIIIGNQQIQGENQQQQLSPTSQSNQHQFIKIPKPLLNQETLQELQQAYTHYPEQEINTMNLQIEEKQAKQMENLLHLPVASRVEILNNRQKQNLEQLSNLPSIIKSETTSFTENYQQNIDT